MKSLERLVAYSPRPAVVRWMATPPASIVSSVRDSFRTAHPGRGPAAEHNAESVAALRRLVDECEEVLNVLGDLSESILGAASFNLWYEALADARAALNGEVR